MKKTREIFLTFLSIYTIAILTIFFIKFVNINILDVKCNNSVYNELIKVSGILSLLSAMLLTIFKHK